MQVTVTVIYCLFAAGIVFGYAAIKPVLKKEGAYREICRADGGLPVSEDTCVEIHLNLMFTVSAVGTNVAALPIGTILDHYGPRVCGIIGSLFLAAGALVMAFEKEVPFDGLLLGYLLLALGGPFTYISSFQLSNAFPRNSGFILALLTGAFDASSALFLVYRLIYQSTEGLFDLKTFFLGYLVVPVAIVLVQLFLLPSQSYKTVGELIEVIEEIEDNPVVQQSADDQIDEHTALLQDEQREHQAAVVADIQDLLGSPKADKQAKREERKNEMSGVWGVMHHNTAWEQIRSPWFLLICLFTGNRSFMFLMCLDTTVWKKRTFTNLSLISPSRTPVIQMTRINYFVATIRPQYEAILGSRAKAIEINNFFDLALPLGGIISIPFIGVFLDHTSTSAVLTALVTVSTAIGVFGIIPEMWAAYTNVCLFVLYRPFYYTAVSDYSAQGFGFRTFGTV